MSSLEKPTLSAEPPSVPKSSENTLGLHHTRNDADDAESITTTKRTILHVVQVYLAIAILLVNYFLAQYDKFILSYFQDPLSADLNLSSTGYAILSGYATGIVYAFLALPIAYIADYTTARVWVLTVSALWWSLCVVFQSLTHKFWQILLARIGMGVGQAAVEALSLSLISDLVTWRNVFIGESVFYVGVYIGEAISGQIATAFRDTRSGWRTALRAIGITGLVVAVLIRLIIREPDRRRGLLTLQSIESERSGPSEGDVTWVATVHDAKESRQLRHSNFKAAKADFVATVSYILRMHSFWILVLSAGARQLSGNVFGYYMPTFLSNTYPDETELLSRYGIIVGTVGSVTVLLGGVLTSLLWDRTQMTPLYLTGIGGMISSIFVLLMIFSKELANGNQANGVRILYGTMCAAYLTAELWLGCVFAMIALLLPRAYKTFGLAIWSSIQVLIYSSGPEIIGLALRKTDAASADYTKATQIALAVIIPVGYWLAGIGFLLAIPALKRDLNEDIHHGALSARRKSSVWVVAAMLGALVVSLFVVSIVYKA